MLKLHASCCNSTRECINHNRACRIHTRKCNNNTHTGQNYTLRIEITPVNAEIEVVRILITLRVEITLCV
jgi:hypothetical protein